MSILKRSSLMALNYEVVEGTPVFPSAGTDFIPLQDDYTFESTFDEIASAELNGSIGQAKATLGLENPTMSFSAYLKHSGVEGQEPSVGKMIHGVMGEKTIASTEYDTIGGSTVSTLKVGVGEGVNFERGQAVLVKQGAGYEIRNVLDVATDDLNLLFNLKNAPGAGVNLGKAVLYSPADEHPSFTATEYEGRNGLVQMISGLKVASLAITADPENFLVGNFSFEGLNYYRNPLKVVATNKFLDFNIGGPELNAEIPEGVYRTPHDLASAIESAMVALAAGITVVYSDSTGKFTIAKSAGSLSLLWNTGINAANTIAPLIGFLTAADDTALLSYAADNAIDLSAPFDPVYDSTNAVVAKNGEVYLGDATDISCFGAQNVSITITNTLAAIADICEESGRSSRRATSRQIELSLVVTASKYDVSKFEKFRNGSNAPFMMNLGRKLGGNWVPGECVNFCLPTATITSDVVADVDGITVFNLTVKAFVENGLGEFYINFI